MEENTLKELFDNFIELKQSHSIYRNKTQNETNIEIKLKRLDVLLEKEKEYLHTKDKYMKLKIIEINKLSKKYDIQEYIRPDFQFKNLDVLEASEKFKTILKDTDFLDIDTAPKIRLYVLLFNLKKSDTICNSENCNNQKIFNKSSNSFSQFCNEKHSDINKISRQKSSITMMKKYGVSNSNQISNLVRNNKVPHIYKDIHPTQNKITNLKDLTKDYIILNFKKINGAIDIPSMCKYFNFSDVTAYSKLKEFNIDFKNRKIDSNLMLNEIKEFLTSIDIKFISDDSSLISPQKLDIICPDHNIAIEFVELSTHSYGGITANNQENLNFNKYRHVKITDAVEKSGYQLFHIFENEWVEKNDIWKSQLRNAFKKNIISVGARKCTIKELTNVESNIFLEQNHLQGICQSSIRIGLYYDNKLISLMSFGKSRFDKNIDYELLRFCSLQNYQVPGAATKLLKYFERNFNPQGLISYANRRWSTGNLYKTIGFTLNTVAGPNYFYFRNSYRLDSRVKFQKHKLHKVLKHFDPNLTEMQNVTNEGYRAIFDSGNISFIKKY